MPWPFRAAGLEDVDTLSQLGIQAECQSTSWHSVPEFPTVLKAGLPAQTYSGGPNP